MKLEKDSIEWAIDSLDKHGDTDLFPKPIELKVISELGEYAINLISDIDLSNHNPSSPRRFVVPKDDLSVRPATQLDPLDSIIFTAIMYQFGEGIEQRRVPFTKKTVFSYRFDPNNDGDLYKSYNVWNEYWEKCISLARVHEYVLVADISDFYNQIYHHTVENQLIDSNYPNQVIQWIKRLFGTVSAKVSRGIPVGPHASHLIAEASLIPIDNSLQTRGMTYCRFVDDFAVFTNDKSEARRYNYQIAEILDKQQRLQLQRKKTQLLSSTEFIEYAKKMIEDRPINDLEGHLISIIRKHSNDDPYKNIFMSDLSKEELKEFNKEVVEKILSDYLSKDKPDFVRLRWFIRRLTQIGHKSAIDFCLDNFEELIPAISEISRYFVAVSSKDPELDWEIIGGKLLDLLSNKMVKSNAYFQISILSLFSQEKQLNHIPRLVQDYNNSSNDLKRNIILAAAESGHGDWLRELKEQAQAMAPWTKRAFIYAAIQLPADERKFFLRTMKSDKKLNNMIIKWAK